MKYGQRERVRTPFPILKGPPEPMWIWEAGGRRIAAVNGMEGVPFDRHLRDIYQIITEARCCSFGPQSLRRHVNVWRHFQG